MSFGGTGGFGSGFGATNNNNTSGTGFGGFGASTTNNTGFGGSTNTGFGANTNTAGSSLFGGGASTAGGGGFGGFGATNNNTSTPFGGAKPAFGATNTSTGGGLFGASSTATTGNTGFGGGFGNTANTGTGFGAANTGSTMFGQNKPASTGFGGATGGNTLFGGGNTTGATGGFGSNATATTGFGGAATTSAPAFGGAPSQPQNQGTASTPFSPFIEKDSGTNANSHYQSISFMQPYQPFSFEELRLADYTAGRKYGNSNGQAGAFGQSTGFGGFGANTAAAPSTGFGGAAATNTGGGLFGGGNNNAPAATGFGATANNASTGFGGSGGLFGQNKPATGGGLFGSTPASTAAPAGGLFGGAANNNTATNNTGFGGGFGANNNTQNQGATGGLFGGAANNTQNKPAFGGGFGGSNTASTGFGGATGGGFGQQPAANNTGGGGLFGQSATANASPFGGAQQNNAAGQTGTTGGLFGGSTTGGFGQNTQNQQQQPAAGGSLFGGGFGGQNNQQKPSPFGGAATAAPSGGLFGQQNNNQQQQQNTGGGGLFGGANNQNQQGGGLFGAKPAAPAGGLFGGGATTNANTGGGLFGGAQPQQQNAGGGGLFGQSNNQQKPGGLFGNSGTQNAGGGGLFGGLNNNNQQPQQQQNGSSGGLFGNSTQQQNQNGSLYASTQQPSVAATLLTNPYGNDQLFSNLGNPSPPVGPLATPLSGAQKPAKRPAALPQFKINPSASLRLITPQKRSNGYGFSYATYGTPGSAQSFTSNGLGSSLLQSGGLSRSLGKSFSTSNLHQSLGSGDSVLAPGAFTPNNRSYTGGSIRRLRIDRNLRTDLFGDNSASEPAPKRVSFDAEKTFTNGTSAESTPNNALVRTETEGPEPSSEELGLLRAGRPTVNGVNGVNGFSSSDHQAQSNELAMVPEDELAPVTKTKPSVSFKDVPRSQADQNPGEYWMSPSLDELRKMSREQLKKVSGFSVGRWGSGRIDFDEVDLTTVPLDDVLGGIVRFETRSATVYESGVNTPPMGKGLNVPSTITLENSWPRAQGGRLPVHERKGMRFDKHLERLRRVVDTEFISYDSNTGIWIFRVQHFTTYGLDDDEDEEDMEYGSSTMSTSQEPTPKGVADAPQEVSQASSEEGSVISDVDESNSDPDDTFDFKKGPSNKIIPGSFGAQSIHNDDEMADDNDAQEQEEDSSFLNQRGTSMLEDPFGSSGSENAPPVQAVDIRMEEEDGDEVTGLSEQDLIGSSPEPDMEVAPYNNDFGVSFAGSLMPKSILKASTMFNGTPKKDLSLAGDWAEQLQRTASPKKQDRQALRERQNVMGHDNVPAFGLSVLGKDFTTTMDIMNSLWGQPVENELQAGSVGGKGFEWPYQKKSGKSDAFASMDEPERDFRSSVKPHWATDGTLIYGVAGNTVEVSGNMVECKKPIVSEHKDIHFAQFNAPEDTITMSLQLQLLQSTQSDESAQPSPDTSFAALADSITHADSAVLKHERSMWRLASILFDSIELSCAELIEGIPAEQVPELEQRIRRDALSLFWTQVVQDVTAQHAKDAATPEEKAIAFISGNNIEDACAALIQGRDFRLATIVSQLPGDSKMRDMMADQVDNWRSQNLLSEMSEPIRAIYDLVAGNVCTSEGKAGATEDRASTFGISSRFGLDWRRSFGLRLWFAGADDSLVDAVQLYVDDISSGKETVLPVPYFTEQGHSPAWKDDDAQDREDTLLGLLKLYARKPSSDVNEVRSLITNLLSPASVSASPLNARLAWQIATLLRSKGILSPNDVNDATLDELTLAFSSQLETANELVSALKVLLHLTSASARETYIRDLLYRRASALYDPNSPDALPAILTEEFALPEEWLWHARALYARSMLNDHNAEATYLLRSGDINQAHSVLCRIVGPAAIVECDYDALRELLGQFHDMTTQGSVENWRTGGQVYFDYIHLLDIVARDDDHSRNQKKKILERLSQALPGVLEGRAGKVGLEERVAVGEMAGLVKAEIEKMGREEKGVDRGVLDRLPTAGDSWAKQGVDLSRAYYRAVVA